MRSQGKRQSILDNRADSRKTDSLQSRGSQNGQFGSTETYENLRTNAVQYLPDNGVSASASSNGYVSSDEADDHETTKRNCQKAGKTKANVNGIGARIHEEVLVNGTAYSRTVCDTYRHENDLLHGRLRGGRSNENVLVVGQSSQQRSIQQCQEQNRADAGHDNNGDIREINGYPEGLNGHGSESNGDKFAESRCNVPELVAPLATPEHFSDDEEDFYAANSLQLKLQMAFEPEKSLNGPQQSPMNQSNVQSQIRHFDNRQEIVVSSSSESLESIASDEFCEMKDSDVGKEDNDEPDINTDVEQEIQNLGVEENIVGSQDVVENVDNVVEETELDNENNDDVGDFIEADLPPNVERLVFFSRDSASEEDEGCGDEVLLNNEEEHVSDNETIDPTCDNVRSLGRPYEPHVLSSEHQISGPCNLLSRASGSVRGEIVNSFYTCNISCDKSTEENNVCSCEYERNVTECDSYNVSSHETNSSVNGDNDSANIFCACCDKPMVVESQRHEEFGVTVCEQCSKELNAEQSRLFDNGAKHRTWPGTRTSSSNNFLNRSCGNTWFGYNNIDKVSNNCSNHARFSSSDSDPYDSVFESDLSELLSQGAEASGIVHPSNRSRADVQYREMSVNGGHIESHLLHRQSMSLDFASPEETFYCPYYNRRSRSLDQNLLQCDYLQKDDSSSSECEELDGAIAKSPDSLPRSNFHHDEVNMQEKVFEKAAYKVPGTSHTNFPVPIPTCSSSDEEENIKMPVASDLDLSRASGHDLHNLELGSQRDAVPNSDMVTDNLYHGNGFKGMHNRGQKLRLEDTEPIYEDIDQLDLLMEEEVRGHVGTTDHATIPQQPVPPAIAKLRRKRRNHSPVNDVEKVMIWNEYEAYVVQVKQIGTSACGPTAVLNVLKAFDFQVEKEEVACRIRSNLRMEAAPVPYYLFSRYNAGTTAQDLVDGVREVTRGAIQGRFFHFYPPREINLLKWLGHWMKKGAVPVATLNLQRGVKPGWTIPDAWHHQMVYGVSSKGVYLTNPLEIVPVNVIMEQLTSDSVLLVRRQDVVSRFRDWCPLNDIIKQADLRWRTMNVLGQIVHMLREHYSPVDQLSASQSPQTSHICIPAAYKAGIILFMRANTDTFTELMNAPELREKQSTSCTC